MVTFSGQGVSDPAGLDQYLWDINDSLIEAHLFVDQKHLTGCV